MMMNLKKTMRIPAPESMLSELGLDRKTTIGGLIDYLLKRLHGFEQSRNTVTVGSERVEIVERYGSVELNDNKLRAICAHAWPLLKPEMRAYLSAIGLAGPLAPGEVNPYPEDDINKVFEKLFGTPEQQAEREKLEAERAKLRELAYVIVARTATREELALLVGKGVIDEPPSTAITVPADRLLQ
jgi:hypothetical protein